MMRRLIAIKMDAGMDWSATQCDALGGWTLPFALVEGAADGELDPGAAADTAAFGGFVDAPQDIGIEAHHEGDFFGGLGGGCGRLAGAGNEGLRRPVLVLGSDCFLIAGWFLSNCHFIALRYHYAL